MRDLELELGVLTERDGEGFVPWRIIPSTTPRRPRQSDEEEPSVLAALRASSPSLRKRSEEPPTTQWRATSPRVEATESRLAPRQERRASPLRESARASPDRQTRRQAEEVRVSGHGQDVSSVTFAATLEAMKLRSRMGTMDPRAMTLAERRAAAAKASALPAPSERPLRSSVRAAIAAERERLSAAQIAREVTAGAAQAPGSVFTSLTPPSPSVVAQQRQASSLQR